MVSDPKRPLEDPEGAQQRFLSVFLRSEREIFRYVAALIPNVADAEDIVQQTALVLWEKFDAYDASQPFTPWACRFALNKTRQWLERRHRWQVLLEGGLAEELAQRREELRPTLDLRIRHLEGCLGKLPEEQLSLVEGYYYRRDSIDTLAASAGKTVAATYKILQRVRMALQACIENAVDTGGLDAMKLCFPSPEFDNVVASACHGSVTEEEAHALNQLLREDPSARDEYILRVELHSRLASDPDLLAAGRLQVDGGAPSDLPAEYPPNIVPLRHPRHRGSQMLGWAVAAAACIALLAIGGWGWRGGRQDERKGATSKAVAMLSGAVGAQWHSPNDAPRSGAPLDPGWLRLRSGMAQVTFYSGARVVIEGPAELQIISSSEASCRSGRLIAEVPPQASGFRIATPQMDVTDLGTAFGLDVKAGATELHVFKGRVEFASAIGTAKQTLQEGSGAVAEGARPPRLIAANEARFASMFNLEDKAVVADSTRYDRWRAASLQLNRDSSLLVHFDFERAAPSDWRLRNVSGESAAVPDGTIVGCQWVEGRWPAKQALEFRGVSDRVRLSVPGEYESLTLSTWVRVQGLDRQFNSLFMSDGFDAGTLHWLIRKDGVLGLTVIGQGAGNYQIVTSTSVLTLDQFGMWMHLAVVVDGGEKRVVHYLNGRQVSEERLKIDPPFRIGTAELGNWNARGFQKSGPFMIRNFSGAMDEFCLFNRALSAAEIRAQSSSDHPQPAPAAKR